MRRLLRGMRGTQGRYAFKKSKIPILKLWLRVDQRKTKKEIMEDDTAVTELTDLKVVNVTDEDQGVRKNHSNTIANSDSSTYEENFISIEEVNENKLGNENIKYIPSSTPTLKYREGNNTLEEKLKDTALAVNYSKQDKYLYACLHSDKTSSSKVRDTTPEHSDSETQTEASSDRRKHQFRRSISLRRSLFRRSQKKKQKSLELSSSGSVVAPSGALPFPLERYRREGAEPCPSQSDSGIEDSDMSSKNSNLADEDTDDRLMEMLDQSVSPGKLNRSQSFRKKRKKLESFFMRRKLYSPVSSPSDENGRYVPGRWGTWSSGDSLDRKMSVSSISSVGSENGGGCSPPGLASGPASARSSFSRRGSGLSAGSFNRDCVHVAKSWTKEEYVYRLLLHSVVNPLGAPDVRPGFRPKELAQHLRQVFGVEAQQHEAILKDTHHNASGPIVLTVNVVEGRNLRPMDANGLSDPYCILCLAKPHSRSSLKSSPTGSPNSSRRRKSSVDPGDLRRTHTVKATLHPKWNEAFEIEVRDIASEELLVYLWDNDEGAPITDSMKYIESQKSHGLKSWLKQIKTSVDYGKAGDDFLGMFRVPLKDIPATGHDKWFDLYEDKKSKIKVQGQCRLRLELAFKQHGGFDQLDCAESDQCSLDDFHSIVTQIYKHAITQTDAPNGRSERLPELTQIPSPSRSILNQFAVQHHIPRLSQQVTELTVLLELATNESVHCVISERLLHDVISAVDTEWMTMQMGYLSNGDNNINLSFSERTFLTDSEGHVFERAASAYVDQCVKNLSEGADLPVLFPPFVLQLEALNNKISLLVELLSLQIWPNCEVSRKELATLLIHKIQSDAREWVQNKLQTVHSDTRRGDPVLAEVKMLVHLLQDCSTILTPAYSIAQYFNKISVDYFRVTSLCMESKLAHRGQELMQRMDKYQVRHQKYRVNIRESSQVSLQLYLALRNFYNMVKSNISERELFRLTVSNFQSWFETSVIFWLHTFREECIRRTDKALEIDRDVVQVTAMVKYSNSSVDVLSCFTKMTMEWRHIDFGSADIQLLGVTKITDTICDGARQYAERIQTILEKNRYYDAEKENQFDVKDQLCITINNIEHVREYLMELSKRLNFETVTQCMSIKHEDEIVGKQALATLNRLVKSADCDIKTRCCLLLTRITSKMTVDLNKYTQNFTRKQPDRKSSVDPLLAYLDSNLQVLYERLETRTFPHMLAHLWQATLECFFESLMNGRPPSYYEEMYSHLRSLRAYFHRGGISDESLETDLFQRVQDALQLNCLTTEELMLQYYYKLAEQMATPMEYYGHLALRIGFVKETGNTATVYATVCGGQHLPSIRKVGTSDSCVSVTLVPCSMFATRVVKTTTCKGTVNPTFQQTFQFPGIPLEFLTTAGSAAIFTVWHEDIILPNDYLGEVVVSLSDISEISANQTIEDVSVTLLPLKRPLEPETGPYQVISERSEWDRLARTFLKRRRVMAGYASSVPLCSPVKKVLSKVLGRNNADDISRNSLFGSSPVM